LLTLFTDAEQLAVGYNDEIHLTVGTKTFGEELASIGLPVSRAAELDLEWLFSAEDVGDFLKNLKFKQDADAVFPAGFEGVAMTAEADGVLREMTLYINKKHTVLAARVNFSTDAGTAVSVTMRPADGGSVILDSADISTPYGTIGLSGELTVREGSAVSDVRDISADAYRAADLPRILFDELLGSRVRDWFGGQIQDRVIDPARDWLDER
jgi:hypothetical protein